MRLLDYESRPNRWPTWIVFGLIPLAIAVLACLTFKYLGQWWLSSST